MAVIIALVVVVVVETAGISGISVSVGVATVSFSLVVFSGLPFLLLSALLLGSACSLFVRGGSASGLFVSGGFESALFLSGSCASALFVSEGVAVEEMVDEFVWGIDTCVNVEGGWLFEEVAIDLGSIGCGNVDCRVVLVDLSSLLVDRGGNSISSLWVDREGNSLSNVGSSLSSSSTMVGSRKGALEAP